MSEQNENQYNFATVEGLRARFKPTAVMRFINIKDATDFIDFRVRKIDAATIGTRQEREIVESLMRMQSIVNLDEAAIEKMTPEEIAELLNVDQRIRDLKNNDAFLAVAADFTVMQPTLPASVVLDTLPLKWVSVIVDFTVGGVSPPADAVDGFKVEVLDDV